MPINDQGHGLQRRGHAFRDRSFTLTTVATLTVALSLVTVVFAVFNAYVLRPYAVRDQRLMRDSMGRAAGQANRRGPHVPLERLRGAEKPQGSLRRRDRRAEPATVSDGRRLIAAFVSGTYSKRSAAASSPAARARLVRCANTRRRSGRRPQHRAWTRFFDRDPPPSERPSASTIRSSPSWASCTRNSSA